jgi:hypothetical protein
MSYAEGEARGVSYDCGETVRTAAGAAGEELLVEGPSGPVEPRLVSGEDGFSYEMVASEPGFYRIGATVIAAKAPVGEAEVRLADMNAVEAAFGAKALAGESAFPAAVRRGLKGSEMSAGLLTAALAALVLEMILVYYFKRGA